MTGVYAWIMVYLLARRTMATSSFNVHDATKYMFNMYVVVPADKAPSDIVFICKRHSIDCSTIELDIDN
jgi:hypothetical protein